MDLSKLKREDVRVVDDDLAKILAETIGDYETRTGKTLQPAHIERLLINTYAYREALVRQAVNEAYRQQHPRFATGLMLDLCGDDVNTPRLQASAARCTLRFAADLSGQQAVYVAAGTRVSAGDVMFETTEAGSLFAIKRTLDLQAVCTQLGEVGNGWHVGQINQLVNQLESGIHVTVGNINVPTGGSEIEQDDAYRERIMLAFESFSVAGPAGAYKYFALSASPVITDVYVDNPVDAQGAPIGGRVDVTVLTRTGLPSPEVLSLVQAAISGDRRRPLCDSPMVKAPETVDYAVTAQLVLISGTNPDQAISEAKAAWTAYETVRRQKLGVDIVPLDIQTVLKVSGVYNVVLSNVPLRVVKPNQWARCTAVTITAAPEQVDG